MAGVLRGLVNDDDWKVADVDAFCDGTRVAAAVDVVPGSGDGGAVTVDVASAEGAADTSCLNQHASPRAQ